jgi:hypothetical protein
MVKKKDDLPDWVIDEIKNAKFGKPEPVTIVTKRSMCSCMKK